jgi:ATP-dependent Lon protease
MPATRWNSNDILEWLESLDWSEEENATLKELIFRLMMPPVLQKELEGITFGEGSPETSQIEAKIPEVLPILPLRGLVVYPETAVPLTIGQPRSIRLVDEVVGTEDRLIGLLTSRNPELETPEPKDLYTIGTVGIVHRLFRAPDGTIRLLVQGIARYRVKDFYQVEPYLKANIELIPETTQEGLRSILLARARPVRPYC